MASRRALLLAPILALAALLRFTALDWGLRHVPHSDERSFVENVARMIAGRDLDHRFYEYPGLFLYLLIPVQAAAGVSGPAAYHAARGLVAFFGVASVGLAGLLGFRLGGTALGLTAAFFLAVAPLEVVTSHTVRPDVALETFAALSFLAFLGIGREARGDWRSGAALGAAASIKFTGLLLVPSYLLARALAPGPRVRGLLRAAGLAALLGLLFTPYAVLHFDDFARGAGYQMDVHYKGQAPDASYLSHAAALLRAAGGAFEPPAALLALAGLALALRRDAWRRWLPLLVYPLVIVLVMATVDLLYLRHVVPALFVVALLAALPVHALAARRPWLAVLVALGAAAWPLRTTWNYLGNISGSIPRDRVLDWAEAHLPPGAVVLDARPELGLGFDRRKVEVIAADEQRTPLDPRLAENVDAILTGPGLGRRWGPLATLFPKADGRPAPLHMQAVVPERRARYLPVPPDRARLSASHRAELLPLVHDDDLASLWTSGPPQAPGQWLQAEFDRPVPVARIELVLGPARRRYAGDLRVWTSADGREWRRSPDLSARGPVEEQVTALRAASQLLIVEPVPVRGVRLAIGSPGREPWEVAELRFDVRR